MSNWVYILLVILAIYIALSLLLYFFQEQLLFKPEKLPADFKFFYENQKTEEYNLTTRDGAVINGLHFKAENPKGVVLYLKGNSKSIKGWGKFAVDLPEMALTFLWWIIEGLGKVLEDEVINILNVIYNSFMMR